MKMKAFDEYEKPEYIIEKESRNKVIKFLMNCSKVGVCIFAMLLLGCSKLELGTIQGGVNISEPSVGLEKLVDKVNSSQSIVDDEFKNELDENENI